MSGLQKGGRDEENGISEQERSAKKKFKRRAIVRNGKGVCKARVKRV